VLEYCAKSELHPRSGLGLLLSPIAPLHALPSTSLSFPTFTLVPARSRSLPQLDKAGS